MAHSYHSLRFMFVFLLTLAFPLMAAAGDRSMGDGASGEMQDLNAWNNDAMNFSQESGKWKAKWYPEKVGAAQGKVHEEKAVYCLSNQGDQRGADILRNGNATSKSYEAYLATHSEDAAARTAYENHERNLQEFYKHWKKTHESAHCS